MIDRCAGRRLEEWLSSRGHDVIETRSFGRDPGDREILEWAAEENRFWLQLIRTSVN
jgi:predicted nuclease of predicted toxin-antitoxin system